MTKQNPRKTARTAAAGAQGLGVAGQDGSSKRKAGEEGGCEENEVGGSTETSMSPSQVEARKRLPCGKDQGHYGSYRAGPQRQEDSHD